MRNIVKLSGNKEDIVYLEVRDRDQVLVGKRSRDINDGKVNEIAESIEAMGVLEPIIVTHKNCFYTVVAGAHRWRAICKVWDKHGEHAGDFNIPAKIIHVATGDEEVVELAENLHRNDLTKEERKVMVLRYDQLLHNGNKSHGENKSQGRKGESGWFVLYVDKLGKREAYRMWDEFKVANGLDISPSKASVEQQQQFAAWHLEQSEKRKADEAAAKQKTEDEVKQKTLKDATEAYERAKGLYQRACDIAEKAGVQNIQKVI